MASRPKRPFEWLSELPTTNLRIIVSLVIIVATAFRYLVMSTPLDEFGQWLMFLAGLAGIDSLTVVGKRFTADPAVITAEAAARQVPPPAVSATHESVDVIPVAGAEPGDPPVGP